MSISQKIYIRLLEGTDTLVPCSAIMKGENIYEIVENPYLDLKNDATSIWQFFPGDITKCILQGDVLVAQELVSSNFPDRRIHELIYIIVKSLGEIEIANLPEFQNEIERLCNAKFKFRQKDHPIVKQWVKRFCTGK